MTSNFATVILSSDKMKTAYSDFVSEYGHRNVSAPNTYRGLGAGHSVSRRCSAKGIAA